MRQQFGMIAALLTGLLMSFGTHSKADHCHNPGMVDHPVSEEIKRKAVFYRDCMIGKTKVYIGFFIAHAMLVSLQSCDLLVLQT